MGRSEVLKGQRVEREIKNAFIDAGLQCERVPLSGAAGGSFSGDLVINGNVRAEVKVRGGGGGMTLIERWLAGNDALIVKSDRRPPLVVIPFDTYTGLLVNEGLNRPVDAKIDV